MSDRFQGCSAKVRESFPYAVYVHSVSHSLNLALCHTYKTPVKIDSLGTLNKVNNYFRNSPK